MIAYTNSFFDLLHYFRFSFLDLDATLSQSKVMLETLKIKAKNKFPMITIIGVVMTIFSSLLIYTGWTIYQSRCRTSNLEHDNFPSDNDSDDDLVGDLPPATPQPYLGP